MIVTIATATRRSSRMVSYDWLNSVAPIYEICEEVKHNRMLQTKRSKHPDKRILIRENPGLFVACFLTGRITRHRAWPLVRRRPRRQTGESSFRKVQRFGRRRARCRKSRA